MTDLAQLGIQIDSRSVPKAVGELDRLTAAGARAEATTLGLGKGSKSASVAAAEMAAAAQLSARAATGMAGGAGAASLAMQSLGTKSRASSIQIRESLVLMREASVGNFTRMAGSASILAGSLATTGSNVGVLVKQLLTMVGILKTTQNAELAEAAVQAAASAASVEAYAQRAAAAIAAADTELAVAQAAARVAATSEAEEAAQLQLAAAHEAVATAAAEATIAENALADAQGRAGEAAAASEAATVTSLGAVGTALAVALPIALALGAAFEGVKQGAASDAELKQYAANLGLTHREMKRLTDVTVTWGDVTKATFQVVLERAGISSKGVSDGFSAAFKWIGDFGKFTISILLAGFASLVSLVASLAVNLGRVATGNFSSLTNPLKDMKDQFFKTFNDVNAGFDKISKRATGLAQQRIKQQADEIIADRTPKKDRKESDHGLADALAQLDAQIKGQLALAAAYQVSNAAAIKAEALQKAEEQAIRHKGEVGIFYEKELALAIATRAAEGAKTINGMEAETSARKRVNDAVSAGALDASQMETALKNEAQLRPLIAAQSIAEGRAKELLTQIIDRLSDAQAASNFETNRAQVLAASSAGNDQLEKLKLEAKLIGATNAVRAEAIAQLEAEQFLRDHPGASSDEAAKYLATQVAIAQQTANLTTAQDNYNNSLSYMVDLLTLIDQHAQTTATSLSAAFGNIGAGIGTALTALSSYAAAQAKIDQDHKAAVKAAGQDAAALAAEEILYAKKSGNAQIAATAQIIGGLKSMFKEHSVGYKAMEAAERAFAVIQAISTIKSVAAGAAKMFSQLGVWAFPAVAAMIAVMAGLGFRGGSSSAKAPTSAQEVQTAQGAGTVLGDVTAKSDSIAHSLDLTAANTNKMLEYDNQQLRALRGIEDSIGVLTAQVAKELQVGGAFDLTGKTGTSTSGGFLGLFSTTKTSSLYDQGLQFDPTSLANAIANGVSGATYQIIETVKKNSGFLGIGGSTKTTYDTTTGALDPALQGQVSLILGQLRDSVVQAAKVLGFDVQAALDQFQVEIGKISFKDMSADEIQKALEAVFSKVADQMAGFAVSSLENFQKAGEGLFETLQRLAKDYTTIDVALKSIGKTFGSVGAASISARESLIALFGSLQNFVDQTAFYQQNFLSGADQYAINKAAVDTQLAALGLSNVTTIAQFNQVVQGIDLTTAAGQQLYASMMALAPAFLQVEQYQQQQADAAAALAKQKAQMQVQLLEAQGNAEAALAAKRKLELAALDPSLRALQQQIYQAQDIASAKDKLAQAYQRERSELEATISKYADLSKSLKDYRDTLFGGGSSGQSYNQALANLIKTGSLAAAGDETALGNLPGVGKSFLDIAKDSAGSLQQYQRDVALVARYVDQGITAADGQVSVAQKQLDTMTAQVGKLIDINTSVLSVKQAIIDLQKLMGGTGTTPPTQTTPQTRRTPRWRQNADLGGFSDLLGGIHDRLDDIRLATMATAGNTRTTAKIAKQQDRGGSIAITTDSDTPIATTAS